MMRKIKLHHPQGHPYWQRNKFVIENEDGKFFDVWKNSKFGGCGSEEYEVTVSEEGVYIQYFHCSSGSGKVAYGERFLAIKSEDYDEIEYVGVPLVMSKELKNEVADIFNQ